MSNNSAGVKWAHPHKNNGGISIFLFIDEEMETLQERLERYHRAKAYTPSLAPRLNPRMP